MYETLSFAVIAALSVGHAGWTYRSASMEMLSARQTEASPSATLVRRATVGFLEAILLLVVGTLLSLSAFTLVEGVIATMSLFVIMMCIAFSLVEMTLAGKGIRPVLG